MDYIITGGVRKGSVLIPASKSFAHRYLIAAALSNEPSVVFCDGISKDIQATMDCLSALGACFEVDNDKISVSPIKKTNTGTKDLFCNESGSTLRFLIPIVGALGEDVIFHMEGRLAKRPLNDLTDVLTGKGMSIRLEDNKLYCSGTLRAGYYSIPGNVSSQYVTGLLFSLPLLAGDSTLNVYNRLESENYVLMSEDVLEKARIRLAKNGQSYEIPGNQSYSVAKISQVERDWSNACFFLCMGAMSKEGITLNEMSTLSSQGDKNCVDLLKSMGVDITETQSGIIVKKKTLRGIHFDASAVPDLVPAICALAAMAEGTTTVYNALRLRDKESDRIQSTVALINALGGDARETEDGLVVKGRALSGGTIDAMNDHRIAMAAAVASVGCKETVVVTGAECVAKSYPNFWRDFEALEVEK